MSNFVIVVHYMTPLLNINANQPTTMLCQIAHKFQSYANVAYIICITY